jgi:hypothetical protein
VQMSDGRPRRVTRATIGRRLGAVEILERSLDRLPLTRTVLSRYVEEIPQFRRRRLVWIATQMDAAGVAVKPWVLIRAAGLKQPIAPDLVGAIDTLCACFSLAA